jgi:DNA helicase II / ATP-dependent DNA helicase PcrA
MNEIYKIIADRHIHLNQIDKEQMEVIFSHDPHLIVEAPAGYGKTKTMVSKIAYLLCTYQVPYPKKILALTFSINAAFKIRNDLAQQLPLIFESSKQFSRDAVQSVHATNYHGMCRRILKNFGYLISKELSDIDNLKGVGISIYDDSAYTTKKFQENVHEWGIVISMSDMDFLIRYTKSIKDAGSERFRSEAIRIIQGNLTTYLQIVKSSFLPKGYILFDAILLFTRQLFRDKPNILSFYKRFYPVIFVDEFQDTNILQWSFLQDLVGRDNEVKNQLFLFGDHFQKIYEFIGAMQGIIDKAGSQYNPKIIKLLTNHRFIGNSKILTFDENIRKIVGNLQSPEIEKTAILDVIKSSDQNDEGKQIVDQIQKLIIHDPNCSVAILVRAGKDNQNTRKLVEYFNLQKENGFLYFYALYSDEDLEYIDFHKKCLSSLYKNLLYYRNFTKIGDNICKDMKIDNPTETWESLLILLDTFFNRISKEFRFLTIEEKIDLVIDTLRNNALKQYLMYIKKSQVTLSTIHGSKGLEWDYVILPDMEKSSFPSYPGLCKACGPTQNCQPNWNQIFLDEKNEFVRLFKEEINVFYVGGTRAKKAVYFTYSVEGLNARGEKRDNQPSCFLKLEGFQINAL